MANAPTGRLGDLDFDGNPHGFAAIFNIAEVDPTDPAGTLIFEGAKRGRTYVVEALCDTDDCWSFDGSTFHGPDGSGTGDVGFGDFKGYPTGTLLVQLPGMSAWKLLGDDILVVQAFYDGDFLGVMADAGHGDNAGSMPVRVTEFDGSGPPDGRLDILEEKTFSGTGGAIPPSGTRGTSTFEIPIPNTGVINEITGLELTGLEHTFANDLKISLISPGGVVATVVDRLGAGTSGAESDYDGDYLFENDAEDTVEFAGGFITPGLYRPQSSWAKFVGTRAAGTWKLRVQDLSVSDTGSLDSWTLKMRIAETDQSVFEERAPLPEVDDGLFRGGGATVDSKFTPTWPTIMPEDPGIINIPVAAVGALKDLREVRINEFSHGEAGDVQAVLQSPSGTKVTVFHRPGSTSGGTGNTSGFSFGDYTFVESGEPLLPDSGTVSPGRYSRDPGDWPGTPNNFDVPVGTFADFEGEDITGVWKLYMFSWGGLSSSGSLNRVQLIIDFFPPV